MTSQKVPTLEYWGYSVETTVFFAVLQVFLVINSHIVCSGSKSFSNGNKIYPCRSSVQLHVMKKSSANNKFSYVKKLQGKHFHFITALKKLDGSNLKNNQRPVCTYVHVCECVLCAQASESRAWCCTWWVWIFMRPLVWGKDFSIDIFGLLFQFRC